MAIIRNEINGLRRGCIPARLWYDATVVDVIGYSERGASPA